MTSYVAVNIDGAGHSRNMCRECLYVYAESRCNTAETLRAYVQLVYFFKENPLKVTVIRVGVFAVNIPQQG